MHYVWSLEHRPTKEDKERATGYHYHLAIIFNRDITPSNKWLVNLVNKGWSKKGGVHVSHNVHLTPSKITKVKMSNGYSKPLPSLVMNTDTSSEYSVFHHLSYLTKSDPTQSLPSNYKGKSFGVSQLKPEKLTANSNIKAHKLTTKIEIEPDWLDDYTATITPIDEMRAEFNTTPF